MNTTPQPNFAEDLARRRAANALEFQTRRLDQLTRLIDELSGEMGSWEFVLAMRERGYDIDADRGAITRRQATN